MTKRQSPNRQAHSLARIEAKKQMQLYYPDRRQLDINKVDPVLWAILYQRALSEIKEKEQIKDHDYSIQAKLRLRTRGGQFAPTSTTKKAGGLL